MRVNGVHIIDIDSISEGKICFYNNGRPWYTSNNNKAHSQNQSQFRTKQRTQRTQNRSTSYGSIEAGCVKWRIKNRTSTLTKVENSTSGLLLLLLAFELAFEVESLRWHELLPYAFRIETYENFASSGANINWAEWRSAFVTYSKKIYLLFAIIDRIVATCSAWELKTGKRR